MAAAAAARDVLSPWCSLYLPAFRTLAPPELSSASLPLLHSHKICQYTKPSRYASGGGGSGSGSSSSSKKMFLLHCHCKELSSRTDPCCKCPGKSEFTSTWKPSHLQCDETATYFVDKSAHIWHILGTTHLAIQSEFGVGKFCLVQFTGISFNGCHALVLRMCFRGMQMTSWKLAPCLSCFVKTS